MRNASSHSPPLPPTPPPTPTPSPTPTPTPSPTPTLAPPRCCLASSTPRRNPAISDPERFTSSNAAIDQCGRSMAIGRSVANSTRAVAPPAPPAATNIVRRSTVMGDLRRGPARRETTRVRARRLRGHAMQYAPSAAHESRQRPRPQDCSRWRARQQSPEP